MLTHAIRKGRTAVHWAVHQNQPACIEALVKMKANVHICDKCACLAACCGCKVDLKLLRRNGDSPLRWARSYQHRECIAVLEAADGFYHASAVRAHRTAGTITFTRHRGEGYVTSDYMLHLLDFNTFVADVRLCFGCFYFELQVFDIVRVQQFGFCTQGFERDPQGMGVGDDEWSWAVDGVRKVTWYECTYGAFGSKWDAGDVIGFALDMRTAGAAVMSVSVNGSFAAPNGPAFTAIDAPYLSPAFTGDGRYRVNFGDRPFVHAPPDAEDVSVHSVHEFNKQQLLLQQQQP